MSEVIKRDQNGYKIYPLPDGSEVLWAEEDRVLFHRSSPESMPLTTDPDGVFEDLLALVDSLKHRIKVRESQLSYRKRMATIRDEKLVEKDAAITELHEYNRRYAADVDHLREELAEKDRTIAMLEQRMEQSHRDAVDARVKQEAAEDDRDELRKALEEIADSKNDMSGVLCRVTARKALRE
jgi:chromosome segregation ATPase